MKYTSTNAKCIYADAELFFPFHAETGGLKSADSSLDCHAYDSCVHFTAPLPHDTADVGMVAIRSPAQTEELRF